MSQSEDYLDDLLHAATSENGAGETSTTQEAESIMDSEKKFLDDFEKQMMEDQNDDSFLLDFEKELNDVESASAEDTDEGITNDNQSFLDDLNGIVNGAKQTAEEREEEPQGTDDFSDFNVDTLSDPFGDTMAEDEQPMEQAAEEMPQQPEESADTEAKDDGMDFMSLFEGDDDFSDIGELLHEGADSADAPEESQEEEGGKKGRAKKSKKKDGEKEGFFQKLGRVLFGEDEEEQDNLVDGESTSDALSSEDTDGLSDENLEILAALGGSDAKTEPEEPQETEEEKKARLKKEKKEAKEKEKKEKKEAKEKEKKEKKAAKEKAKREKPPKPPKEKDNTPPLPKKPVILMFVMAFSILLLVILGSNLLNYSSSITTAKQELDQGNYTQAYEDMAGLDVKEADMDMYQKTLILASVQSQYEAYESFMQDEDYDLALDALISVIGRYDLNYEDAETYGCTVELGLVEQDAENALTEHFSVTADQAREMYGMRSRKDYSLEVYKIIRSLGLEKVAEE